uniref:Uncharacterized protein n=1 Tax=Hucho hucho TaxID=62062 RepID=A0A4W5MS64_9TELE
MADVEGDEFRSALLSASSNGPAAGSVVGTGGQNATQVTSGPRMVRIVKSESGYGFNVRGQPRTSLRSPCIMPKIVILNIHENTSVIQHSKA